MRKLLIFASLVLLTLAACTPAAPTVAPANPDPAATTAPVGGETTNPTPVPPSNGEQPTPAPEPTDAPTVEPTPEPQGNFVIVSQDSQARFFIEEILLGADKTVIGTTNAVTGFMDLNFEQPSASSIGTVEIDASTFQTDSGNRNTAIRNFILETSNPANRYITFVPSRIIGLPSEITFGSAFEVSIEGQLTIHGVTQPATFTGTITPVSAELIEGFFTTTVARADYDLTIPQVPSVSFVAQEVILEFEFVAASR